MALDLSNDWKVIDDLQTVTYFVKSGEGAFTPTQGTAVPNVYAEELSAADYQKAPHLLGLFTRAFNCWTNQLSGITPRQDDKLTDSDGLTWFVDEVQRLDRDGNGYQRWRLLCQGRAS